jgi:membrane-bound serine protease (ClpP class)
MNRSILIHLLLLVLGVLPNLSFSQDLTIEELSYFQIQSAITPATYEYLSSNFKKVPEHSLIVIKMNTPGGLVSTTKEIISLMGQDKNPVAIWITPESASAASAGAIIASGAHFILMAPGTVMGAATPVGINGDIKESDGRRKAMNDLKSLVRSLSVERNRPGHPFELMVEKAESYTAQEALKEKIIEGVAANEKEMVELLKDRTFKFHGAARKIQFSSALKSKNYDPNAAQQILDSLADPNTAYILFLIGIALVFFEFQAPGGYIAGAVGFCLMLISGMAFQVLPLDWGAFGMMMIGLFLFIVELYVTSYGALFIGGVIFFGLGSLFLFQDHSGFISVQYSIIYSALTGVLTAIGSMFIYLWREKKKPKTEKDFFLPQNAVGVIMSKNGNIYQVRVRGEIWNATSKDDLAINEEILVEKVDPKKLLVQIKKR